MSENNLFGLLPDLVKELSPKIVETEQPSYFDVEKERAVEAEETARNA